jgi:predicted Zn-dependent protease
VAGNPRVEELRKRLEREPGSRLFAQYAEELRRAGELEEAVKVCREGLTRHPGYPSARITLGRALLDLGSADEAAAEFAAVLEAAPDNLSASRYLGECLEKRGETAGAL